MKRSEMYLAIGRTIGMLEGIGNITWAGELFASDLVKIADEYIGKWGERRKLNPSEDFESFVLDELELRK